MKNSGKKVYSNSMRLLQIQANSYFDAGKQIGIATRELCEEFLSHFVSEIPWETLIKKSLPYLAETKKSFPHLIEEMRGLADGVGIPFEKVWAFNCREEVEGSYQERCSSVFVKTESGWIIGHNEDDYWGGFQENEVRDYYFIVSKYISENELTYLSCPLMIGGETVSINSSGVIQTVNTLHHSHFQVGVPKNIIARAVSEAKSIEEVVKIFTTTKRASGYCHNLLINNNLYCIESTSEQFELIQTTERFVHTNHYLGSLSTDEDEEYSGKAITRERCSAIVQAIGTANSTEDLKKILFRKTESDGSIYRTGEGVITMATTIIDTKAKTFEVANNNKGEDTVWENVSVQ